MFGTLQEVVKDIEHDIAQAPPYRADDWEDSFADRQKHLREDAIGMLISFDHAVYEGTVGDHSLELGGIKVHSDDGYKWLLLDWCDAARAAIAAGKAAA